MFQHLAFSINDINEIKGFYIGILGMKKIKNFTLNRDLSKQIFNFDSDIDVFLLKKDDLVLELFISKENSKNIYNHICIEVNNREELYLKAKNNNYECLRINRDYSDLIFIKDKSYNLFEIKEKE